MLFVDSEWINPYSLIIDADDEEQKLVIDL